jgi:hypothetical protein
MTQNQQIPKELDRWNLGAMLLAPFWCLRHGVWQGFLLLLPLVNIVFLFFLGARANRWAWRKNRGDDVAGFLKQQRFWTLAGVVLWAASGSAFFYMLNYSEGIVLGLDVANSNQRVVEYFGAPIEKSSRFSGTYSRHSDSSGTVLEVGFQIRGEKEAGRLDFTWEEREGHWVATNITVTGPEGDKLRIGEDPILQTSFGRNVPYTSATLVAALNRIEGDSDGYITLIRSRPNNDFLQARFEISDSGEPGFVAGYSNGFTRANKELYESKYILLDMDDLIQMFDVYASGHDAHLQSIEWERQDSTEPLKGTSAAYFTFQ